MNVIKHMEAAFLFALSVAGVGSVLVDSMPQAQAHVLAPAATRVVVGTNAANIPVVTVTAKRMSVLEKQRSLAEDTRASGA